MFKHAHQQNLPSWNLPNNIHKELVDDAIKYSSISSYRILDIVFSHIQADLSVPDFAAQLRSWSILSELVKINFQLPNGIKTKKGIVLGDITPFSIQYRFTATEYNICIV